jgi:hypothetical protein
MTHDDSGVVRHFEGAGACHIDLFERTFESSLSSSFERGHGTTSISSSLRLLLTRSPVDTSEVLLASSSEVAAA